MSHRPAPDSPQDAGELEVSADQAIAACGGDMREAVKALIVANDFVETEVAELMRAVSQAYVRGRFKPYNG
jgi:stage V sporulation protein SpoVS